VQEQRIPAQAKATKGGAAYAAGKTLVVFLDAGLGEWKPNLVDDKMPPEISKTYG
jgi:hypothetical protein